jgi:hypothetical protein
MLPGKGVAVNALEYIDPVVNMHVLCAVFLGWHDGIIRFGLGEAPVH